MRIALTGNPNSGKTTMFNALTGRNEKVGNWAGVTVERKEHKIKKSFCGGEDELIAVDLPGAYSMSPFTSEESITFFFKSLITLSLILFSSFISLRHFFISSSLIPNFFISAGAFFKTSFSLLL